jgi:hypothetical protein
VKESCFENLGDELAASRVEILQLADRVRRLVARQTERQELVQRWRQLAALSPLPEPVETPTGRLNLCGLCATERATATIHHVGGCIPGAKCDQCSQPAIMWMEIKNEPLPAFERSRR